MAISEDIALDSVVGPERKCSRVEKLFNSEKIQTPFNLKRKIPSPFNWFSKNSRLVKSNKRAPKFKIS